MWNALFSFVNSLALAGWAMLVFLPRRPLVHSLILYLGTGLLCMIYAVCLIGVLSGTFDPAAGAGAGGAGFGSIAGVRAIFQSDGGVVIGWTHYLTFDLFTGLWIARDGDAKGFSRVWQAPFLLATFIAGPLGLLAWLIVRERAARRTGRG